MQMSVELNVLEILGDAELLDPRSFYGQNALKVAMLAHSEKFCKWHYVGFPESFSINADLAVYHRLKKGSDCLEQLRNLIFELAPSSGGKLPIVCSYLVQSYELINTIFSDTSLRTIIAPIIVLHCTSQELLPDLFGGGQTPTAVAYMLRRAVAVGATLVFVSKEVQDSFQMPEVASFLGSTAEMKTETIGNAIDTSWLLQAKREGILRENPEEIVIGFLCGFKPYKGCDIIKSLLHAATQSDKCRDWIFAFSALPNYGTKSLLQHLITEHQSLLARGNIRLYIDISQWMGVSNVIRQRTEAQIAEFRNSLSDNLRICFDSTFKGVSIDPVHRQMSVQLRPSLHEAFGRAVAESLLLQVPVISSDRDALRDIVPAEWQVALPKELTLSSATSSNPPLSYFYACDRTANEFIQKIETVLGYSVNFNSENAILLADLGTMIQSYKKLLHRLAYG